MRTSSTSFGLVTLAMAALAPMAIGQISVNESSFGGDFSGNFTSPTNITPALGLGLNTITGAVPAGGPSGNDVDYFRVTLPAGMTISAISLTSSNFVVGVGGAFPTAGTFSLASEAPGPNVNFAPFTGNGTFPMNFNITNPSNIVFSVSGPFGTTSSGSFDYVMNLTVVPTPGAAAMLGMGALAAARRRRR